MKDPRTHVVPAGSPVTVHYNDSRPPNHTRLDFPFFFDIRKKTYTSINPQTGDDEIVVVGISISVNSYVFRSEDVIHKHHLAEAGMDFKNSKVQTEAV